MASSCSPIRQNFKRHLAQTVFNNIQAISPDNYFLTIGKVTPWPTEVSATGASGTNYARPVPIPYDTDRVETEFWQNVVAVKRITKNDISLVVPRFDWKLGSVYQPYRDNIYLFDPDYPAQFYVLVDETRVYKCIDNNYGAASTVVPMHTDPDIRKLADGYRWKFIYQIPEDKRKFLTKTVYDETTQGSSPFRRVIIQGYMPVSYVEYLRLTEDDRVLQWNVQQAAVNGQITFVGVKEEYKPYLATVNCLKPSNENYINQNYSSGHTGDVRFYSPYLVGINGFYNNLIFSVDDGPGEGQRRVIKEYIFSATGNYGSVTLDYPLSAGLSSGDSKISIIPHVRIEGDGFPTETTLNHFPEADVTVKFGSNITGATSSTGCSTNIFSQSFVDSYEIVDGGKDYTQATFKVVKGLTFTSGLTGLGSLDDTADIVLSPPGGHGSNAIREFGAATIMVVVEFSQSEKNTIPVTNDYRQFGIIKNPILANKHVRLRLGARGLTNSFVVGASVTQGTTGQIPNKVYDTAVGKVVSWRNAPAPVVGQGLSGVDMFGVPELIVNNITGGNFYSMGRVYSSTASSNSGYFNIAEVSVRDVAGTEGRELLKLKVVPATLYDPQLGESGMTHTVFNAGGDDFHPGLYVESIGNMEENIENTRFSGSVYAWEPSSGANTTANLYIENASRLPNRFEKLVQTDFYNRSTLESRLGLTAGSPLLGPSGGTAGRRVFATGTAIVMELDEIIRSAPSIYDQTTSMTLTTSLSNPFGPASFEEDEIIKSMAGFTAEGSAITISWSPATGATNGSIRVCGTQGSFTVGSTITFTDSNGNSSAATISSIQHEAELKYRSGELTYIQNTQPIRRNIEQKEELKILFQF